MLRVGLIGFGLAGQAFHAPLIRAMPGMELACIVQPHGSTAREKYPDVRSVRALDDLLADKEIRVCIVATPNSTHFDLARRCLLDGRDVVVDKPFTATFEDGAELIRIAEERGRVLTAFQNRRWDGDFLTIRGLLASESLGRIVSYESNYDRFRPLLKPETWRERPGPGSGILFDMGPHALDQVFELFGEPVSITADIFTEREGCATNDAFFLRLEYPGMHAILRSSMLACAPGPRFLLHGTKGSFVKHGVDAQEHALRLGEVPAGPRWGENPESEWGTLYLPEGNSFATKKVKTEAGDYRRFYENLRDAILAGAPLSVQPRDALRTIRAIEFAIRSSRERRTISWKDA